MDNAKYFSRSWALLTRDKGWIKPILVMSAAALVPIVGEFGNNGYALEWGRLTAWGVDAAPKQKNVDVGKCVTSGARAFVVSLGMNAILFVAYSIISLAFSLIPGTLGNLIGSMASLALSVVMAVMSLVILLAQLRCAIYEKIGAGYRIDRVFELVKKDGAGFARVFLVSFVCSLIIATVVFFFVILGMLLFVPILLSMSNGRFSDSMAPAMITGMIVPLMFGAVIIGYVISLLTNAARLIVMTSLALWLRQFDVPNWCRSEDPLPVGAGPQGTARYAQQPPAQQWQQPAQQPHVAPQQPTPQQQQTPVQQQDAAPAQIPPDKATTQRIPHKPEPDDLYDSMADVIRDNDRVEGDD